ncbi:lamin tail domain-containing protein [Candidatus Woesearchaeota archaeon]|nr:lamin tail domain-containing protein [Candidatus Woesearchaeota archaeon]
MVTPAAAITEPEPASFSPYDDYITYDLSTGDVGIRIPLVTVPGRNGLDFPVILEYNAGISVMQDASWVGLGWKLDTGSIERTTSAIPDDYDSATHGNNVYWYSKFTSPDYYQYGESKMDWFGTLFSLTTTAILGFAKGGPVGSAMTVGYSLVSNPTMLSPVTYVKTGVLDVPSSPDWSSVDGFLKSYAGVQNPTPISEEIHDINFPDIFIADTPVYEGKLVYGKSIAQGADSVIFHAQRANGHLSDVATDAACRADASLCSDNLQISFARASAGEDNGLMVSFSMTTADGTIYEFEGTKKAVLGSLGSKTAAFSGEGVSFSRSTKFPLQDEECHFDEIFNYAEISLLKPYYLAWGLTAIRDPQGENNITFTYTDWSLPLHFTSPDERTGESCRKQADGTQGFSETYHTVQYLKTIETPSHIAVFFTEPREDGLDLDGNSQLRLRRVSLFRKQPGKTEYTEQDIALTTYSFTYDYSLMNGTPDNPQKRGKLTLKQLTQCGAGKPASCPSLLQKIPPYNFTYFYPDAQWDVNAFDRWGYFYYNKNNQQNHNSEAWEQKADGSNVTMSIPQAWSLQNITWPTGGATIFVFESDRYKQVNNAFADSMGINLLYGIGEQKDTHFGGGIRLKEVSNCPSSLSPASECITKQYLYEDFTNNSLINFEEKTGYNSVGTSESSGIATGEPGTFESAQDSIILGSAYSTPQVQYSKVTEVIGGDDTSAPYGYTVYEFSTAKDYPNEGFYQPPIVLSHPANINWEYGFSFRRAPHKHLVIPKKFMLTGPKNHTMRFIFRYDYLGACGEWFAYWYKDYTLPSTSSCNLEDQGLACMEISIQNTHDFKYSFENAQEVYNRKCLGYGSAWCPRVQDCGNDRSCSDAEIKATPAFFFFVNGWDDLDYLCGGTWKDTIPTEPWGHDLECLDNDNKSGCDLISGWDSLPTSKRYNGDVDTSDKRGLLKRMQQYAPNGYLVGETTYTYRLDNAWMQIHRIDPQYHFPKASWIPTNETINRQEDVPARTTYIYDELTGQPEQILRYNSDGTLHETKTQFAYEAGDAYRTMRQSHLWNYPHKIETFTNGNKRTSFGKTCYDLFGGYWQPKISTRCKNVSSCDLITYGGTGDSLCTGNALFSNQLVIKYTNQYNVYGHLLQEINPRGFITRYFYSDTNQECDNQQGSPLENTYLTCIQRDDDDGITPIVTEKYGYDNWGNLISFVDANEQQTSYQYDSFGRLSNITKPEYASWSTRFMYQYQPNWIRAQHQLQNKIYEINSYYDTLGRKNATRIDNSLNDVWSEDYYDKRGLVKESVLPYYEQEGKAYAHLIGYAKDPLARKEVVVPIDEESDAYVDYTYSGNTYCGGTSSQSCSSIFDEETCIGVKNCAAMYTGIPPHFYGCAGTIAACEQQQLAWCEDAGCERKQKADNLYQVTIKDENNNNTNTFSDVFGRLVRYVDQTNASTAYGYDSQGNLLNVSMTFPLASTRLLVSEIFYDPIGNLSASGGEEEFIEIYNAGETSVSLDRWILEDKDGRDTITTARTLSPGEIFLIAENRQDFVARFGKQPDDETTIELNNQGDCVNLYTPEGNFVDGVGYEQVQNGNCQYSGWMLESESSEDDSFQRICVDLDTNQDDDWEQVNPNPFSIPARCGIAPLQSIMLSTKTYDSLSRMVGAQYRDGGIKYYSYDDNGNIQWEINAQGTNTSDHYDALDRLVTVDYLSDGNAEITYLYDNDPSCTYRSDRSGLYKSYSLGRLCKVIDDGGTTELKYDKRGRVIRKQMAVDNRQYTLDYTYDPSDNIIRLAFDDGKAQQNMTYDFDALNHLRNITIDGRQFTYAYDASENVRNLTYPHGVQSLYTYYPRNWLKSIDTKKDATSLFKRSYNYDGVGNIVDLYNDTQQLQELAQYSYDDLYRLTKVTGYRGFMPNVAYDYDALGNRGRMQEGMTPERVYEYTSNTSRLRFDGASYYSYDAAGNMITLSSFNLVANPSFEVYYRESWQGAGAAIANWKTTGWAGTESFIINSEDKTRGEASITARGLSTKNVHIYQDIDVLPRSNYTASGWVKNAGTTGNTGIGIWTVTPQGNWGTLIGSTTIPSGNNPWKRINVTFMTGQNDTRIRLSCFTFGSNGGNFSCDEIQLTPGPINALYRAEDYLYNPKNQLASVQLDTSVPRKNVYTYDYMGKRTRKIDAAGLTHYIYSGKDLLYTATYPGDLDKDICDSYTMMQCNGSCYREEYRWDDARVEEGSYNPSCCGDDSQEAWDSFVYGFSEEGTYDPRAIINNSESACCDTYRDCILGGSCYASGKGYTVNLSQYGTGNDTQTFCRDSGIWYDCDYFSGDPENPTVSFCSTCNTSFRWLTSGTTNVGEYSAKGNWGCCGDDPQEYIICNALECGCCNDQTMRLNSNGQCIKLVIVNETIAYYDPKGNQRLEERFYAK